MTATRLYLCSMLAFGLLACGNAQPDTKPLDSPAIPIAVASPRLDRNDSLKQRLVAAYPLHLDRADGNWIIWKDGTRMEWDDGRVKTPQQREEDPDLEDMFYYPYPLDSIGAPAVDQDPGRIRQEAFFRKMYGTDKTAVGHNLVQVQWPKAGASGSIQVTTINGVDRALKAVVADLAQLSGISKYLENPGGGYYWRPIAGTQRLSAHSWGIAVDIATAFSDYWRWSPEFKAGRPLSYHNRIPSAIVRIFEKHGFIWGGKWYHYDSMHFEYRPELLP